MEIFKRDILLSITALTIALMISMGSILYLEIVNLFSPNHKSLGNGITFFVFMAFSTGFLGRIIHWINPLQEGQFYVQDKKHNITVWKLLSFLNLFNLNVFPQTFLVPVNARGLIYNLLGSKIGKCTIIGGSIIEPFMVEVGHNTILGEDCRVVGHAITDDQVHLAKIRIGNHVTIGVKSVIMPGVEIGDHSVVLPGCVVPMGTKIEPWEVWGGRDGVLAKKLKKRNQKMRNEIHGHA